MSRNEDFILGKWTEADQARHAIHVDNMVKSIKTGVKTPYKTEGRVEDLSSHLADLRNVSNLFKKAGTYTPELRALHAEHVSRSSVPMEAPNGLNSIDYDGILRGNDRHGQSRTSGYRGNSGIHQTPVKLDHTACPFCDHSALQHSDFMSQPHIQAVITRSRQFSDQFFASQNKKPEDKLDKEYRDLTNG